MLIFSIILGKFSSLFIKKILNRNASTWPGHLVLETNSRFINDILQKNSNLKLVLIAGTNGKTTTTKALDHILKSNNISVIRNDSGANLLNGLASLLVKETNLNGRINKQALLFEVDENSLPLLLQNISPLTSHLSIVLLNLFRDQLDRYGEINITSDKWREALTKVNKKTILVANADDPQMVHITSDLKNTLYFSIPDGLKTEKTLSHAVDSTSCPKCHTSLFYSKISYSHIGNFKCPKCNFTNPKSLTFNIKTNLKGTFNLYNLTAAIITSEKVFDISQINALPALEDFKPAFGRQEELDFKGKKIKILLSKNPTGFNESLKVVMQNKHSNLLILLNDRIPDGRDISWIWDVDFEMLNGKNINITVSGDRTFDMANRLKYADLNSKPIDQLGSALTHALKQTPKNETLIILPTYSAMLEIRKILTGKSIL